MDLFVVVFYACLCALIGLVSPHLVRWYWRFAFGATLGISAAVGMPHLRAALGM